MATFNSSLIIILMEKRKTRKTGRHLIYISLKDERLSDSTNSLGHAAVSAIYR